MTRAEILDCLTDRPCDVCRFHESGRCERWDCVFEEKPDDCEDAISRAEAMTEIMMFAGNMKPDEENIYIKVSDAVQLLRELPSVTPKQKVGYISIDDAMSVFDDYMCGDIDEAGAEIFLEMLKDKAESEGKE